MNHLTELDASGRGAILVTSHSGDEFTVARTLQQLLPALPGWLSTAHTATTSLVGLERAIKRERPQALVVALDGQQSRRLGDDAAARRLIWELRLNERQTFPTVVAASPDGYDDSGVTPECLAQLANDLGVHLMPPALLRRSCADGPAVPASQRAAVVATAAARKLAAVVGHGRKVIVLDCDNTLWVGECGEVGASGVAFDEPHLALHRFMAAQRDAGMLLCACSKNAESDVRAVFSSNPDLPLSWDDFVAIRVNWLPKSENVRSLARELGLSPESFIFVDDDPLNCAEVEARFPSVLTVTLPPDPAEIAATLDGVWAFDHAVVTEEDRRRTVRYQQERTRRDAYSNAFSLDEFRATLKLTIEVRAACETDAPRLAQLTRRTTQFNCCREPMSESDIREAIHADRAAIFAVSARDRFGDYGVIGVSIVRAKEGTAVIDAFLVSCRALGRGVEWALLGATARRAATAWNIRRLRLRSERTERNEPVRRFLRELAPDAEPEGGSVVVSAADALKMAQAWFDANAYARLQDWTCATSEAALTGV